MAARTAVEEIIAGIWADVLKLPQVGVEENFFELGGHSLLATQAISRIRGAFRVQLPLRAFFESPTVSALAKKIEQGIKAGTLAGIPRITPPTRKTLPLSYAQERMWFLHQTGPGKWSLQPCLWIDLKGKFDREAFGTAASESR